MEQQFPINSDELTHLMKFNAGTGRSVYGTLGTHGRGQIILNLDNENDKAIGEELARYRRVQN